MAVYIFIHPKLTKEKYSYYLQNLKLGLESQRVQKVYFIPSIISSDDGLTQSLTNYMAAYKPSGLEDRLIEQYIPEKYRVEELQEKYKEYFKNVYVKERIVLNSNNYQINEISLIPNDKFRTSGIGCKRFLSQLIHNKYHPGLYYCGIDDMTSLHLLTQKSKNVNELIKADSIIGHKIDYSTAIGQFYTDISNFPEIDLYGFTKATEGIVTIDPTDNRLTETFSIYKFIIISSRLIQYIFYDPFCSDFKEDIDFLLRASNQHFNFKGYKRNNIIICKENNNINSASIREVDEPGPMEVDEPGPMEVDEPVPMEVDEPIKEYKFTKENFENYIFFYLRLLNSAGNNFKYYGILTKNKVYILPIITGEFKSPSIGITDFELKHNNIPLNELSKTNLYIKKEDDSVINFVNIYTSKERSDIDKIPKSPPNERCNMQTYNDKTLKMLLSITKFIGYIISFTSDGVIYPIGDLDKSDDIAAKCDNKKLEERPVYCRNNEKWLLRNIKGEYTIENLEIKIDSSPQFYNTLIFDKNTPVCYRKHRDHFGEGFNLLKVNEESSNERPRKRRRVGKKYYKYLKYKTKYLQLCKKIRDMNM